MAKNEYNGRNGNGYQPLERPPTVEYRFKSEDRADFSHDLLLFMAVCFVFMIGFSLGYNFGS